MDKLCSIIRDRRLRMATLSLKSWPRQPVILHGITHSGATSIYFSWQRWLQRGSLFTCIQRRLVSSLPSETQFTRPCMRLSIFYRLYPGLDFRVTPLAGGIPVLRPTSGVRDADSGSSHTVLVLPLSFHLQLPRDMAWLKHPRQSHATWILHPSYFGYTLDLGRHPRSTFDAQGHHHPRVLNANSRGQSRSPRSWICRIGINCGMDVDLAFDVYTGLPRGPSFDPFLSGPVCSRRIDMVAWCILYSDVSVDDSHDFWHSEICHFSHSFTMVLPSTGGTRPTSTTIVQAALTHAGTTLFGTISLSTGLSLLVRVPLLILPRRLTMLLGVAMYSLIPTPIAILINPLTLTYASIHSQPLAVSARGLTQMHFLAPSNATTSLHPNTFAAPRARDGWTGDNAPLLPYRLAKPSYPPLDL